MAPVVDGALKTIAAKEGSLLRDAAHGYVEELARAQRYLRDVY